jgi:hypothetical protein
MQFARVSYAISMCVTRKLAAAAPGSPRSLSTLSLLAALPLLPTCDYDLLSTGHAGGGTTGMRKGSQMLPVSVHTNDQVLTAIRGLQYVDPAKRQLTFEDIAQALEPEQVAMLQSGPVRGLLWMESLSNTIKQLGRDGILAVDLVQDDRGYEYPLVRFSPSAAMPRKRPCEFVT